MNGMPEISNMNFQMPQLMPIQAPMPVCPANPQLAHAYVPFQYMSCIYPPAKGLSRGTIFPELDRPYGMDPEYTVDA